MAKSQVTIVVLMLHARILRIERQVQIECGTVQGELVLLLFLVVVPSTGAIAKEFWPKFSIKDGDQNTCVQSNALVPVEIK